ncbi:MAG TPA: hypothetical protein VKZ96_16480, partial [Thermomicrobiales bacterium]|nr:hypothetical protein [Thermomicrobiales bacterium]
QGNLHYFGTLLDEGWQIKRGLIEGISSPLIDQAYAAARASGALGGKLCGAGGGGYLLLCCPPESRRFLRVMMARHGLEEMSVMLEAYGVRTVSSQSAADRRSVTRSPQRRR